MILDLSDPRIIDENISTLPGVKLMFRVQITELEDRDLKAIEEKIQAVEKMISKEAPIIEAALKLLEPEPATGDVFSSVDLLRKKELEKALEMLGETDENKIKIIDELTKAVVEKIVSIPVSNSKKSQD